MTKTELESDNFFISTIPLPLHIREHNFLIIGLPVAPQLWNGLFPSKTDKMVDAMFERATLTNSITSYLKINEKEQENLNDEKVKMHSEKVD